MTDEEKMANGTYYAIDEERKVIIYDPHCNNHGRHDYDLSASLQNIVEITAKENMPVEITFNGVTFQMEPGLSIEEGKNLYYEALDRAHEEYIKSPEYKAHQEEEARKEAQRKAQKLIDDKLIKDEVLHIEDHNRHFAHMEKINRGPYGEGIIEYAKRWGKLMQAEMKKQGLSHLTPELVRDTDARADIFGMSGASAAFGRNLLIVTWKYGEELAQIEGLKPTDVQLLRVTKSDQAYEFYDAYPKEPKPQSHDEAMTKAGQIIAAVLRDKHLIDKFYTENTDPRGISLEDLKDYIPILELPDDEWQTFATACTRAKKELDSAASKTKDNVKE